VLRRQLRRLGLTPGAPPGQEAWTALLELVARTYAEADEDRYTIERSLTISSNELRELYDDLKQSSETQLTLERDKLRESNRFLDSIIENIPMMIFVKDAEHLRFVRFNRAGEDLVGVPSEDLIGRSDHDMFPPEQADSFVAKDREVLAHDGVLIIDDEVLETRTNGRRHLRTKKIPVRDETGTPR
jgi:PAS domain S-box-containing protein